MDKEQFSQLAPRGTIRRFASAGAINTLLFWIFWEVLRLSPALELLSETGVWAAAWVMHIGKELPLAKMEEKMSKLRCLVPLEFTPLEEYYPPFHMSI